MHSVSRILTLSSTALLTIPAAAWAQQNPAPATASQTAKSTVGSRDIVVTAQRREESILNN